MTAQSSDAAIDAYIDGYFATLYDILRRLPKEPLRAFLRELSAFRTSGRTLFIAGNGGSAATASHMANDFGALCLKAACSTPPLRALALTDNMAFFSAIGNDDGYEQVFVNQLVTHYREGDGLVVISASGNSPNAVAAARWVRERGGLVVGFLGFDGGALKDLCHIPIVAETAKGMYGPVEDAHMILDHLAAGWLALNA